MEVSPPDIVAPLFWDEPESNMNPKLMKLLVQILIELSRNGQQIIVATHDYVLLKWFDLLIDKGMDDHIVYYGLHMKDGDVNIEKAQMIISSLMPTPSPIPLQIFMTPKLNGRWEDENDPSYGR